MYVCFVFCHKYMSCNVCVLYRDVTVSTRLSLIFCKKWKTRTQMQIRCNENLLLKNRLYSFSLLFFVSQRIPICCKICDILSYCAKSIFVEKNVDITLDIYIYIYTHIIVMHSVFYCVRARIAHKRMPFTVILCIYKKSSRTRSGARYRQSCASWFIATEFSSNVARERFILFIYHKLHT